MKDNLDRKRLLELAGVTVGDPESDSLDIDTGNGEEAGTEEVGGTEVSSETIQVCVSGDIGAKFKEFIEAVGDQAETGTGIQITATNNGGEEVGSFYVDGDGADRIWVDSGEESESEDDINGNDDQMYESKHVFPTAIVKFLEQRQLEGKAGTGKEAIVEHFGKTAEPMLKQLLEARRVKQNDKGLYTSTFNTAY